MAGEIGHFCGIDYIGGGLGAVDKIDGSVLQDKDGFLVITPSQFAPFSLDADSGLGENSPQIISPNVSPGDKRWILVGGVFAGLTIPGCSVLGLNSVVLQPATDSTTFFQILDADGGNPIINVDTINERIGIGKVDPAYTVDINQDGPTQVQVQSRNDSSFSAVNVKADGGALELIMYSSTTAGTLMGNDKADSCFIEGWNCDTLVLGTYHASPLAFSTNNLERGRFLSTGEFGIGTKTPKTRVQITQTSSAAYIPDPTAETTAALFLANTGDLYGLYVGIAGDGNSWMQAARNDEVTFYNLILQPNGGSVGIADPAPASKLDVTGDINVTTDYKVDDVKVVGNQGAVVADATDAPSVILRLNELLARCRAHGLIAT